MNNKPLWLKSIKIAWQRCFLGAFRCNWNVITQQINSRGSCWTTNGTRVWQILWTLQDCPHDLFNLVPASNFIPARVRQILILIFNLTFKKVLFGAAIKIAANYCINFLPVVNIYSKLTCSWHLCFLLWYISFNLYQFSVFQFDCRR